MHLVSTIERRRRLAARHRLTPTTSTDDPARIADDLHAAGSTIVMITHDMEIAARADRQLRLADGVLNPMELEVPAGVSVGE